MGEVFHDRCKLAAKLRMSGSSPAAIGQLLGVSERSARTMIYNGRKLMANEPYCKSVEEIESEIERTAPSWGEEARKLRGKGWSVRGIARHLRADEPVVASVLNVEWGGQ